MNVRSAQGSRWRGVALVAATFAVAMTLGACGSDKDSSEGGGTTVAAAEGVTFEAWVAQVDAICANGQAAVGEALAPALVEGASEETLSTATSAAVSLVSGQITAMQALGIPTDRADEANAFLASGQAAITATQADPLSILDGSEPFADFNAKATEIGATTCAS